jgi:hypothetical protein
MGGKVAKKLGDGLMALFGYPVAQENDAERAADQQSPLRSRGGRRALARPRTRPESDQFASAENFSGNREYQVMRTRWRADRGCAAKRQLALQKEPSMPCQ